MAVICRCRIEAVLKMIAHAFDSSVANCLLLKSMWLDEVTVLCGGVHLISTYSLESACLV